jgi:hypothetical protein
MSTTFIRDNAEVMKADNTEKKVSGTFIFDILVRSISFLGG